MKRNYRVGQIVPSSNTTMETEIPAILLGRQRALPEDGTFTFHSSRMRMKKVVKEELEAMDRDVTLRIVVESPPKGVDFSLQKGRGSAYNTVQNQRCCRSRRNVGIWTLSRRCGQRLCGT